MHLGLHEVKPKQQQQINTFVQSNSWTETFNSLSFCKDDGGFHSDIYAQLHILSTLQRHFKPVWLITILKFAIT